MKKLKSLIKVSLLAFCSSYVAANESNTILAIMPSEGAFLTVLEGIRSELGSAYKIDIMDVNKTSKAEAAVQRCHEIHCRALILMDSKAISLARGMEALDSNNILAMPKFSMMTLLAGTITKDLHNVAGINFEIPGYTLVTHFRIISQKDFTKVGVFYRKKFSTVVEEAKKLLIKEQIMLKSVCLDCDKQEQITEADALKVMKNSFEKMVKEDKVEVFWMMADNVIINSSSVIDFWLAKVKGNKIPVIAPLENMASARIGAAIFTADPDYMQLGIQAANEITQVFEEGHSTKEIGFEATISIKSSLNTKVATEIGWDLKSEKLNRINKIIAQ